jgi:hypothetical protein
MSVIIPPMRKYKLKRILNTDIRAGGKSKTADTDTGPPL